MTSCSRYSPTHHPPCNLRAANAKLLHGGSIGGRLRTYDIATSSQMRGQRQFRVVLVAYEENRKGTTGNIDVDSKVLTKGAPKLSLNLAMEDLLKKLQEEMWKD